jgi:hypothetical protein
LTFPPSVQAKAHAGAAGGTMMQIKPGTIYRMIVNIPATIYCRTAIYREQISLIYKETTIAPSCTSGCLRMGWRSDKRE